MWSGLDQNTAIRPNRREKGWANVVTMTVSDGEDIVTPVIEKVATQIADVMLKAPR